MGIGNYIKAIGRGSEGARAISREEAADPSCWTAPSPTWRSVPLPGHAHQGETPQEMAGFLDATHQRIHRVGPVRRPSWSSPATTVRASCRCSPLLALLLARESLGVLVHGTPTESGRVLASDVLLALGKPAQSAITEIASGDVAFVPTAVLHPGLQRLLDVRRTVGVRNSAHSLVKLMNPVQGTSLLVTSYTHPEYAVSMAETLALTHAQPPCYCAAPKANRGRPRRTPRMQAVCDGQITRCRKRKSDPWRTCLTCPLEPTSTPPRPTLPTSWPTSARCRCPSPAGGARHAGWPGNSGSACAHTARTASTLGAMHSLTSPSSARAPACFAPGWPGSWA